MSFSRRKAADDVVDVLQLGIRIEWTQGRAGNESSWTLLSLGLPLGIKAEEVLCPTGVVVGMHR